MALGIKVPLQEAEKTKRYLIEKEMLDTSYRPRRDKTHIIFPVNQKYDGDYEARDYELNEHKNNVKAVPLREALGEVLAEEELDLAKTAYDVVGNIAIIEIPEELEHKEKEIATTLLKANPLVKTVLSKGSKHDGVYRTQAMKYLAGKETKVAEYKENGCTLKVDVEEVYFSARLSTERKRIAEQVKAGEDILVMFSGAAPYPCVFSKQTDAKEIIGVEINPTGHEYGVENIKRNKCENVKLYCGDVREVVPKLDKTFDRIVMPLPKTAEEFLDATLQAARKGAIVHMYAFYHQNEFHKATEEIDKHCKKAGREYEILDFVKAGQHAPRTYRVCVDFKLHN
ncbi:MAG: class I SAM-dependent methyltransferase [Candidatus Woesearchaeota archaeon]